MEFFNKQIEGTLTLEQDLDFHGMINGNLTVPSGRILMMHGMINGDLVVDSGGRAHVAGTVNGTVINHGGEVTVEGTVYAVRDLDLTHPTLIAANAVVRPR
ncbi:autotransporter passenger strand-loop-strand repeat protein [Rhizobium rosettiformans]|uniref:Polymer-forming cytoskeletal protein n=2 Tax=Rhizobium rosettiformans TaxID=1368430 RepID=A0A4S8PEQ4_9HYPH|nr:polymer-forming cytoskeletal protein [Rhizobium rosettiformans]MBB5278781.1 autotransporter passenger strand-loop-strand repeat protein [Rhizobium rosettiformans]THV28913.1 polymer-forming cytoskeletal protein [Rhizobium rosettiformans W3]